MMNNGMAVTQGGKVGLLPPIIGTLSMGGYGITDAQILWTAASGTVTGYKVYQNGSLVATVGNVTSWYTSSLSPTTYYSWYIKAYNGAGDSAASNSVAITTGDYGYPTINSLALSQSASGIQANWNISVGYGAPRTFYVELYHKPAGTGTWKHQNGYYQVIWPNTVGSLTLIFAASYEPIAHGVTYDLWFHVQDYNAYSTDGYYSFTTT